MTQTMSADGAPLSIFAFLRDGRSVGPRPPRPRRSWGPKRVIALVFAILIPLIAVLGVFGAQAARADSNDDAMKYSFYKVASSTTAFFSTVQEPDSDTQLSDQWRTELQDPGSAGSLLGYADPDFSSVSGWLASKLSGSSDAIGYDTLLIHNSGDDAGFASAKFQGMVDYAYFGAALKGMGLDSTSTGLSTGFVRVLSGGVVMLLFLMDGAVDFVFNSFIGVLNLLNPFKLFYAGVAAVDPTLANGMIGNGSANVGPLSGLVSWIGGWYQALTSLSWGVMVPLFIAVLLASLLLFKKLDRGGAIKKIIIRVAFIGLGLPLLGSMYTGMINQMADASAAGGSGSAKVVLSTYVDFEDWVSSSRLAIPDDAVIQWDSDAQQPSGAAQADVRNTALAINNQTLGLDIPSIVSSGSYDASFAQQVLDEQDSGQATSADTFGKTMGVLARYIASSQISSASFETVSKGDLTNSTFMTNGGADTVNGWFTNLTKSADDLNGYDPSDNPLVSVQPGTGLRASAKGSVNTFSSNTAACSNSGTKISNDAGAPRSCNLSPLAMYNYLNTDFGPSSMRMYSSSNVASEATRSVHNSVTQVGTGTMSFLYWTDTVVLLGAFAMIGLGYAFSMLFGSIRRSIQIVTAVPFATLGALAAIAKVVIYSLALIFEIIVTIFVYKMMQELLSSLPQLIEIPFSTVLNNGKGGATAGFVTFLVGGWGFAAVVTILSIIGVIVFTVLAMRVRKALVKAVEEAVTKLVEKFMESPTGMPGGGSIAPALAGGLASGAGMAAANRMMNKGIGGSSAASKRGGGQDGPEGIQTAGGLTPTGPGPEGGTLELEGEMHGPDGGSGSGGAAALPSGGSPSDEVALGRDVEVNGLSEPGEDGANGSHSVQVDDDAAGAAMDSLDKSAEDYHQADKKRLEAAKDGAEAAGHGALAAGRGMAGDYKGAAESGVKALERGKKAGEAAKEAEQKEKTAGSRDDVPKKKGVQTDAGATQAAPNNGDGGENGPAPRNVTPAAPSPAAKPKPSKQGESMQSKPNRRPTPPAPRPSPKPPTAPDAVSGPARRPVARAPRPNTSETGAGTSD